MQPARNAAPSQAANHQRHQPENTLLYQVIQQHYPVFKATLEEQRQPLPHYIQQEFDDYLKCGRLEHGFLRVRCEECHHERLVAFSCKRRGFCPSCGARRMVESAALLVDKIFPQVRIRQWVLSFPFQLRFLLARDPKVMTAVLGIVYRAISTHLIKQAGFNKATARTGAVTLIQRFGSALNLNVHFHMLFVDGVYADNSGKQRFQSVQAPSYADLHRLVHTLSHRIARYLERQGLLERDSENTWLTLEGGAEEIEQNTLNQLHGHSITYRIAAGPQQGRKVFTLQTLPSQEDTAQVNDYVAKLNGFSLHAGVVAQAHQRDKLERLCRYVSRPSVAENRLALTTNGQIRYELKTPYRDGTTHVIFQPLDFIAKLAALIPKPRVNLTRFHGVFAPNSHHRAEITPAGRSKKDTDQEHQQQDIHQRHQAMTWMQRLKRVFDIDIQTCEHCGGHVKVIACIEDPVVIKQILEHLAKKNESKNQHQLPQERAPPEHNLFSPAQSRLFD